LSIQESSEPMAQGVITLNIGGVFYATTVNTLLKYPKTKFEHLAAAYSGQISILRDANGNPFFDRDGQTFRHVLNFMRDGSLILPGDFQDYDMLANEAEFYKIPPLVNAVRDARPR